MKQFVKNILAVLVTKIEIKQLFSITYNVCHYHQNHFNAGIIEKIMLIKYHKLQLIYRNLINADVISEEKNIIDFLIDECTDDDVSQFI